jgi:hypothetical protein
MEQVTSHVCLLLVPAAAATNTWDYCVATTTLSGCKCHSSWSYNGANYYGTCANDGDARGPWCVVDKDTCPTLFRAHDRGAKSIVAATINGKAANLTGLDFDYCQTTTINSCHCSSSWSYNGETYKGMCRMGLAPGSTAPGIQNDTYWCQVCVSS